MPRVSYLYDPRISYEENYLNGPGIVPSLEKSTNKKLEYEIFGHKIEIPFGIPAGPLLNKKFIVASWNLGYSIATYKTVRGCDFPSHPFPNVVRITSKSDRVVPGEVVQGDLNLRNIDISRDGITNSFGVPSKSPEIWQEDVRETIKLIPRGKTLVLSFMGTYLNDFTKTCRLAQETGAPILEVNLSCPNFGKEGLICEDVAMSSKILEMLSVSKGNRPLLVKIGYFPMERDGELKKLLKVINRFANGVAAINTIAARVVDGKGKQLLPGSPVRLVSGICGAKIKWAGLEMAERIVAFKKEKKWNDLTVIGVGGITSAKDFREYMSLGVDAALSATGAMWKPDLAKEIRDEII